MIRAISDWAEFIVVVLLGFGNFIMASFYFLFMSRNKVGANIILTTDSTLTTLAYEIMIFAVIWAFLKAREWRMSDFGVNISVKTVGAGIFVFVLTFLLFRVGMTLLYLLLTEEYFWGYASIHNELNPISSLLFIVFNSIYEEGIVTGYVITALRRSKSPGFAVNVSTGIRFLYHIYQGPWTVATIIPMGLMYGHIYARWKRIIPLIIGHTMYNMLFFFSG